MKEMCHYTRLLYVSRKILAIRSGGDFLWLIVTVTCIIEKQEQLFHFNFYSSYNLPLFLCASLRKVKIMFWTGKVRAGSLPEIYLWINCLSVHCVSLKVQEELSFWTSWPLKMGPIGCPKTLVQRYHSVLRGGSLRSHVSIFCCTVYYNCMSLLCSRF
jgi:hypothetical protein